MTSRQIIEELGKDPQKFLKGLKRSFEVLLSSKEELLTKLQQGKNFSAVETEINAIGHLISKSLYDFYLTKGTKEKLLDNKVKGRINITNLTSNE